jgi:galactokinase
VAPSCVKELQMVEVNMMPDVAEADAPGRVGEHTDYHEGCVLPTIIPQRTRIHFTGRAHGRVARRVRSKGASGKSTLSGKRHRDAGGWTTSRASRRPRTNGCARPSL